MPPIFDEVATGTFVTFVALSASVAWPAISAAAALFTVTVPSDATVILPPLFTSPAFDAVATTGNSSKRAYVSTILSPFSSQSASLAFSAKCTVIIPLLSTSTSSPDFTPPRAEAVATGTLVTLVALSALVACTASSADAALFTVTSPVEETRMSPPDLTPPIFEEVAAGTLSTVVAEVTVTVPSLATLISFPDLTRPAADEVATCVFGT